MMLAWICIRQIHASIISKLNKTQAQTTPKQIQNPSKHNTDSKQQLMSRTHHAFAILLFSQRLLSFFAFSDRRFGSLILFCAFPIFLTFVFFCRVSSSFFAFPDPSLQFPFLIPLDRFLIQFTGFPIILAVPRSTRVFPDPLVGFQIPRNRSFPFYSSGGGNSLLCEL